MLFANKQIIYFNLKLIRQHLVLAIFDCLESEKGVRGLATKRYKNESVN